jgi:hypothetical protein
VAVRISNAKFDPTFLMADVEIVATYQVYNINRTKLANLIHRIFDPAQLAIEIKDYFGKPVVPREWFPAAPLFVIDEAATGSRTARSPAMCTIPRPRRWCAPPSNNRRFLVVLVIH